MIDLCNLVKAVKVTKIISFEPSEVKTSLRKPLIFSKSCVLNEKPIRKLTKKTDYLKNLKSYNNETRLTKAKEIDQKYEKCKQLSDEKVQVANQTYELVDKYIRRLDTDLARFEVELSYYRPPGELVANRNQLMIKVDANINASSAIHSSNMASPAGNS